MKPLRPVALIAAAAALSACSTVSRIGEAINPFDGGDAPAQTAPQDGRQSILAFEQQLTPDPTLAARTITVPPAVSVAERSQPGGTADNSPPQSSGAGTLDQAWRTGLGAGSNNRVKIAAPPVIADGRLFFLDADHRVHAVSATDGRRIWDERLRPEDSRDRVARGGGVAAGGGRVYVTTGFGFVAALDAAGADARREDADRYRQIISARLLRQIGRREIGGDLARRKVEPGVLQRRAHAIARFPHLGVGQADEVERGQSAGKMNLDRHERSVETRESARQDDG